MQNTIYQKQNTRENLQKLEASSVLYSRAKRFYVIQVICMVFISFGWSLTVIFCPKLKLWSVFYSVLITILDNLFFEPKQKELKQEAAKIQELFDCNLLDLDWRNFKVGKKTDNENVIKYARSYKKDKNKNTPLENWYPDVSAIPLYQARIICQRANCRWDIQLRENFSNLTLITIIFLSFSTLGIGLAIRGLALESFLTNFLFPVFPAIIWGVREYKKQKETCGNLEKIKNHLESLWEKAKDGSEKIDKIETGCRFLQDEIYDHRKSSSLIFNSLYKKHRANLEEEMKESTTKMMTEIAEINRKNQIS